MNAVKQVNPIFLIIFYMVVLVFLTQEAFTQTDTPKSIEFSHDTTKIKLLIPPTPLFYSYKDARILQQVHILDTLSDRERQVIENEHDPPAIGILRDLKEPIVFSITKNDIPERGEKLFSGGNLLRFNQDTLVWTTSIKSTGADEIRIFFSEGHFPQGSLVNFFSNGQAFNQSGLKNLLSEYGFYSTSVISENVLIQLVIPINIVDSNFHFVIPKLIHIDYKYMNIMNLPLTCFEDVNCSYANEYPEISSLKLSTAQLTYLVDTIYYWCSGGLLNDTRPADFQPFLLTANHCFNTQGSAASLQARFDYYTTSCNGSLNPNYITINGSNLLATNSQSDFTLVLLHAQPANRCYLGWTTAGVSNNSVLHSVHHPDATPQKYSRHYKASPAGGEQCIGVSKTNFHYARGLGGQTAGGSSGTPIVIPNSQVIGQLKGTCPDNVIDPCVYDQYYTAWGRFDVSFNNNNLSYWLENGANANISTLPSSTLSYGEVNVGNYLNLTVSVTNNSTISTGLNLEAGNITISGTNADQFSIIGSPFLYLTPGSTGNFTIRFTPTSVGSKTAMLNIPHNGSNVTSPEIITLNGTGLSCSNPISTVNDVSGLNPLNMTCIASLGSGGNYAYKWYSGTSCAGTVLGTNSTLQVTVSGNYACKAYISGFESTCYDCDYGYATITTSCASPIATVNDVSGTSPLTMTCIASGGFGGNYAYKWYSGNSCSGTVLGTNSTLQVNANGNYACKVYISGFENICYACDYGIATITTSPCLVCPNYDFNITTTSSWQTHSSSIIANGCKMYKISVTNGTQYVFKTGCGDGATANYDTKLQLYNSSCSMVASDDDGCEDYRSLIVWTANFSGYAYLKVFGYSSNYGNYTMAFAMVGSQNPPCPGTPTVLYEGKTYNTVQIGTQCWFKENLNVGTKINGSQEQTNNSILEKYCYNNLESNCNIYGGLYQWNEMMQYSSIPGMQGICPSGWHIPTDEEWTTLTTFLGGEGVAGGKMKSSSGWYNNGNGTNSSGFSALPGGNSNGTYSFSGLTSLAVLWSSSQGDEVSAWNRLLFYSQENVERISMNYPVGHSVRCLKGVGSCGIASVTTSEVTNITQTSAISGGTVINDGGATVTARGVCWDTSANPTITNNHTTDGSGIGTFTSTISGLVSNTTYYIRAYATNSVGTSYGNEINVITLNPCSGIPTVVHYGQTYNTVQIGTQCWIRENLNVGIKINGNLEQTNNDTIEKYCYNNLESNCNIYGGLYQWNEMMQYSSIPGMQGICPSGWHIPTDEEWTTLTTFLGGEGVAGGKMKSSSGWYNNGNGTNSSGFSALPGGIQHFQYGFSALSELAIYWSSSQYDTSSTWVRMLGYWVENVNRDSIEKTFGFSVRCLKDSVSSGSTASVTTTSVINITQTSAISGGNVISNGGVSVTARGVCWSTSTNPTIANNHTTDGSGNGIFTSTIFGLVSNTTYYIRAYATNSFGTAYGNQVTCTTLTFGTCCPNIPTVTYEGRTYNTVQIGTQCWFKENLNVGIRINGSQNQTNNSLKEKYCYDDLESNCDLYGGLYQWNELMQYLTTPGVQGICPQGWHIPTDEEWCTLTQFIDPTVNCNEIGYSGTNAGLKMKSTIGWFNNGNGTNSSGFTTLPGGYWGIYGNFSGLTYNGIFLSSTQRIANSIWSRDLNYNSEKIYRGWYGSTGGFSVRCLKDSTPIIPINQTLQNVAIPNGQITCYNATQTILVAGNGTSFTVQSGASTTMIAGQNIFYLPGTTVQSGGNMWGYIAPGGPYCMSPSMPSVVTTDDETPMSIEQSSFKIYPNPTTGIFILELINGFTAEKVIVAVYGIRGEKVLTEVLNGERIHEFSLLNRPVGVYFVRVITRSTVETAKIIKH